MMNEEDARGRKREEEEEKEEEEKEEEECSLPKESNLSFAMKGTQQGSPYTHTHTHRLECKFTPFIPPSSRHTHTLTTTYY